MYGLPQSRPWENDQSSVRITPTAPAFFAHSSRSATSWRSPIQYDWNRVHALAATTSSRGLLANELKAIGIPRAAAARATATSPSGWTAWTPVGVALTGNA